MSDGFTWTKHAEHGGYFRCPDDALEAMALAGWEPCETPEPVNVAVVEQLAWRAELVEQAAREEREAKAAARKSATKAAKTDSEEE